jgi:D-alanine-D-alanine ligase-like ATP-grasp enzyme
VKLTVLRESWRPHPLAWIHRAEARAVAAELRQAGHTVRLVRLRNRELACLPPARILLRLSDPEMLAAARALAGASIPYIGPDPEVMERCYDKLVAYRTCAAQGVDCPVTATADEAVAMPFPLVLKPRCGSDSIGVRVLRTGPVPARKRTRDHLVQEHVRGAELTVSVIRDWVGAPLRILLPDGQPYSFLRKYLLRPRCEPVADPDLAERVRAAALTIARVLAVNWAARIDLIHETATGRLCFLECDVAPLVGARSAFAASLSAAGFQREHQLRLLLAAEGQPA